MKFYINNLQKKNGKSKIKKIGYFNQRRRYGIGLQRNCKKIYLYHLQKLPLTRHETRRTNNVIRSEIKYQ